MGNAGQAAAARRWRKAMRVTMARLSAASGYGVETIRAFERGHRKNGEPVSEQAYQRYRLACAALDDNLGDWNWQPSEGAEING